MCIFDHKLNDLYTPMKKDTLSSCRCGKFSATILGRASLCDKGSVSKLYAEILSLNFFFKK